MLCENFLGFCPLPPVSPLNLTGWFAKPKPDRLPAPKKPSGKRLKVLHLSDVHLDPRAFSVIAISDWFLKLLLQDLQTVPKPTVRQGRAAGRTCRTTRVRMSLSGLRPDMGLSSGTFRSARFFSA